MDIRPLRESIDFEYRAANLVTEPIPFDDRHFGSVSAFDFIEHVPRVLPTTDGRSTYFPFIRLMNEVWRVLAPGGLFYALTPTWPNPEVFVDPTHVNVITDRTHEYFCGENPLGRMYGFEGVFVARRAMWVRQQDAFSASPVVPHVSAHRRVAHRVRDLVRQLRGRPPAGERLIYFLWELEAVK